MLRANVGVSKKMSKDYNSRGFTLNLEGEILATPDDPEAVIERIRELYSLAEEALDRQISESQEIDNMARRDAEDQPGHVSHGSSNGHSGGATSPASRNGHRDASPTHGEPASNKQVQFLQTLAKRQKLFGSKLEAFIEETIGRRCSPYDLTKKEAGAIIDALNPEEAGENRPRR
jgi:hypothetical protein